MMGNRLLLIVLLVLGSGVVFAQANEHERKVRFGIFGGSHVFGETFNYEKIETISGAVFGLDVSYGFAAKRSGFSLHIQPNWTNYNRTNNEGRNTDRFKVQAINLPLVARYSVGGGKIRPFVEAGLNCRSRLSFDFEKRGQICSFMGPCFYGIQKIDLQKELSQDRVGLVAGLGVEIDVWHFTIPVTVKINEGFGTYQMKEQLADSYYFDKIKTRNVQVTAGIVF